MAYEDVPDGLLPRLSDSIARTSLKSAMAGEDRLAESAGTRIFSLFMEEKIAAE